MTPFGRRSSSRGGLEPIRILIADDEPAVRGALRRALEKDGRFAIVAEAEDGAEAIAQTATTTPDIVILDLAMPNTNGMQAIPDLLNVSPDTRIVVFSSMASFWGTASEAEALGAALVLDKYTAPRALIKAIVRTMRTT